MKPRPLKSREFFKLLGSRTRRNADRIDRLIRDRAERDVAVFVSDSSGFTRKTHEYGIAQFLSVMTRTYRKLFPLFKKHGGTVVAQAADNLLAVFPDSISAVRASVEIQKRLRSLNKGRKDEEQFHLCIGIESGKALVLVDDLYGGPVNVASKLGEDLAEKGEILITGTVERQIRRRVRSKYTRSAEVGGRIFELFRVSY